MRGAVPFLCVIFLAGSAAADTITLKDGKQFEGEVVEDSPRAVSLKQGRSVRVFKPDDVERIDYSREAADNARRAALEEEQPPAPPPPAPKPVASRSPPVALPAPTPAAPDYRNAKVTLYGTSWCGYCARARAWFTARKIAFTDLDIEKSSEARAEVTRKCQEQNGEEFSGSVPVLDVNGRLIHGFNVQAIEAALKR